MKKDQLQKDKLLHKTDLTYIGERKLARTEHFGNNQTRNSLVPKYPADKCSVAVVIAKCGVITFNKG